jgi:[ribosomal protein S5]-alanine N-acetyltransferase
LSAARGVRGAGGVSDGGAVGPASHPLPTLAGQRCTLRALQPGDAPALQRHADDPQVAFNLFDGFPQPYTLALAETWCSHQHREPGYGFVWGIEVPAADGAEIAGCIGIVPQSGIWACSAEVGYWLGRAHWRRGIVSEALALMSRWAWRALPQINRLWAPIYARNAGSQAVARRCGWVREGFMPYSIQKAGESIDAVVCAAYRPGLPPRHAPAG